MSEFARGFPGSEDPLGKVFVLTGATSAEGGRIAVDLAARGARILLADAGEESLNDLAATCEFLGGAAACVVTTGDSALDVARIRRTAMNEFGTIDVWVESQPSAYEAHAPPKVRPTLRPSVL